MSYLHEMSFLEWRCFVQLSSLLLLMSFLEVMPFYFLKSSRKKIKQQSSVNLFTRIWPWTCTYFDDPSNCIKWAYWQHLQLLICTTNLKNSWERSGVCLLGWFQALSATMPIMSEAYLAISFSWDCRSCPMIIGNNFDDRRKCLQGECAHIFVNERRATFRGESFTAPGTGIRSTAEHSATNSSIACSTSESMLIISLSILWKA